MGLFKHPAEREAFKRIWKEEFNNAKTNHSVVVLDELQRPIGRDTWSCAYCKGLNPTGIFKCPNCGAAR